MLICTFCADPLVREPIYGSQLFVAGTVPRLTLSAQKIKIDTSANNVAPDETARYEPSHQDLHCLPFRVGFN